MLYQTRRLRPVLLASAALTMIAVPAMAQQVDPASETAPQSDQAQVDDVVVTGLRATQRSSIDFKRSSAVIVDAIINDEIGSLPDNSVGDTLERVTGVTADRFKGNANELSVRGLGPTLSFSTFNGREVSTAGPDRSVAFQQFPSELVNGVLVYKSQQADFVDGGIAGVIELRSIRPLEARPQPAVRISRRLSGQGRCDPRTRRPRLPGQPVLDQPLAEYPCGRLRSEPRLSASGSGVAGGLLHHQLGFHSVQF